MPILAPIYRPSLCRRHTGVWTHQKDDVGVLVQSSGHTDPLPLTSTQIDALKHKQQMVFITFVEKKKDSSRITRSPISVWSPKGSRSMSGWREQASITALYLQKKHCYNKKKEDKCTLIGAFKQTQTGNPGKTKTRLSP